MHSFFLKISGCLAFLGLSAVIINAQTREFRVTVTGKSDKPVRSVMLETFPLKQKGSTDKNGQFILKNISDSDSLLVTFPNSQVAGLYSLAGLTELHFSTVKSELTAFDLVSGNWITGTGRKVLKKGEFDVGEEIKNGARNLEDLLKRMPELMVTGGNISLRNPIQTHALTNTAPVIVVDGMIMRGGLAEANRLVNIQTIESITILRDGTLWGREAVNGAIVIKLIK